MTLETGLFPSILPFAFPGLPGISCYFSTALYGSISLDSGADCQEGAVERRSALGRLLGFSTWTELRQVHGTKLVADPEPTPFAFTSALEADGLCACKPGQALLLKSADCQPIMLAHRGGRHIAALHCGWKGNALDFPGLGLRSFCRQYDLDPAEVLAVRGPSLGPGAAEFINFAEEWPEHFRPWFDAGTRTMDLWALTRHQLCAGGMRPEHIFSLDFCTHDLGGEGGLFFSHRRGQSGRQAALIFIG